MIHNLVSVSVLALTCIGCPATAAIGSATAYDGSWSVVISTQSGACDRSYQSGAQIRNGIIRSNTGAINVGRARARLPITPIRQRFWPVVLRHRQRRMEGSRQKG